MLSAPGQDRAEEAATMAIERRVTCEEYVAARGAPPWRRTGPVFPTGNPPG